MIGQRFGRLIIVADAGRVLQPSGQSKKVWECLCDCGKKVIVRQGKLRLGTTKSCGCFRVDNTTEMRTTHGKHGTTEFNILAGIKQRCLNPNSDAYKHYGGRGITVCDRWLGKDGLENFISDMGPRPSPEHTIDREDNSMGYSPDNCRWATAKEQANNTRRNTFIEFDGQTKTLIEWATIYGIKSSTLCQRLYRSKWTIEKSLTTPIKK